MISYLRACVAVGFVACGVFASGCDQLSEFRTDSNSIYRGDVAGSDNEEGQPSFIRQGFESHTRIELTFDPSKASAFTQPGAALPPAGTIDTYVCRTQAQPCPDAERTPGHFRNADLEPIPSLTHDALSQYDFPGGGRLRNYILVSRFSSGTGEAPHSAAMVFLSLLDNGSVEARIIAPSTPASDGGVEQPALFGVFVLQRQAR